MFSGVFPTLSIQILKYEKESSLETKVPTIAAEMIGSVGVKQAAIARQEMKFN
jgi:formyltetrahydrofolate synthetase